MKRKNEPSVADSSMFKRAKTNVNHMLNLRQKLVDTALAFEGKLHHIPSNGYYVSARFTSTDANDFILHFCDSISEIPASVKEAVAEKFRLTYQAPAKTITHKEESKDDLHLSCWDFCFLVLKDTGMVTKEQIDDLCYIVYKLNELKIQENPDLEDESDEMAVLANAIFRQPWTTYKDFHSEKLPAKGDLLVFKKIDQSRPYHCSIALDDKGNEIGLGFDDEFVKKGNFTKDSTLQKTGLVETYDPEEHDPMWAPGNVYYVPLEQVEQNIKAFIEDNKDILALKKTQRKQPESELRDALLNTQYETLLRSEQQFQLRL